MTYDQVFLAAALGAHLVALVTILVFVRRRTECDPKGVDVGKTRVSGVAFFLWAAVTACYVFNARSVVWFGRIAFLDSNTAKGLGIASCTIGLLVGLAGEVALGESFRIDLPRERTRLVTTSIYRYTHNPCVLGMDLVVLGTFFIAPSLLALATVVLNFVGFRLKVQAEEEYLRRVHGAEYEVYCAQTGRFLPRIGRRDAR
jgi:protein-S-isoprenylcysteine O-methyltransferase Ste14